MHPPQWVCDEVERANPWARLAWLGKDRTTEEELNQGSFAIVDLYPRRMADRTFKTPWEDRGPVYGSSFDRLARVPIWVENIPPKDVFSGKVVPRIRYLMSDIRERVRLSWESQRKERKAELKELAGQAGEHLHWAAQKSTDPAPTVADKFVSKDEKARVTGDWEPKDANETAPPVNAIAMS